MTPFNPDSWLDIVAYVILAAPATIAAVAAIRGGRKAKEHRKVSNRSLDQLTNSHDTNLRDDIDKLSGAIRDGFLETRRDIGGLREEIRTERGERIEGDRLKIVRGNR